MNHQRSVPDSAADPGTITRVTVAELERAAHRLRAALREPLAPATMAAVLAAVCADWRDSASAVRRETIAELAAAWGYSEPLLATSLDTLLAPFTHLALHDYIQGRAGEQVPRPGVIGLVMPGNVPGAGLHEILLALLSNHAVLLKMASAEPIFFARFAAAVARRDARCGARLAVFNWTRERTDLNRALANSDRLAVFGSDETVAALAKLAAPSAKVAGFGTRVSGAVVSAAAATAVTADALAGDITLCEQQGCLSPHHVFVEATTAGVAEQFARMLAQALERLARRLPAPRRLGLEDAAGLRRMRETARWRGLGGEAVALFEGPELSWSVISDRDAAFTISPGFRSVTVSPFNRRDDLERRLAPVAGRLEACALAGELEAAIPALLIAQGVSYLCAPGAMQAPPLTWAHGGGVFHRLIAAT